MSKFCTECGQKINEDHSFCINCGANQTPSDTTDVSKNCIECSEPLEEDAVFCTNCGIKLNVTTQQAFTPEKTIEKPDRGGAIANIIVGAFWLILGLVVTLSTMGSDSPVYVIMWGAIIFGLIEMIYGFIRLVI